MSESDHAIDLDAYFARIGYGGEQRPTLAALGGILAAHVAAIPFENLDVLLGRRLWLDPARLEQKLVRDRRGGYCFEQNGLLLAALRTLGFHARPLSARVRYQRPREYTPPRTHLFVRVELDGTSWLADAGVGAMSLTAPLRLATEEPQPTPHEVRRIVREGAVLYHQVQFGDTWHDICEFTLEEMPPIDREVASWFAASHPDSHFKSRLLVAHARPHGARATVLNREYTIRARDGAAETRTLASPDELLAVLRDEFGLAFDAGTRFPCPALDWP